MRPDGWYPDPGHVHEVRYLDHDTWTEFVSDHGLVARDPVIRRRRRWPWVVGGLVGLAVLVLGGLAVVGIGLDRALDESDVYSTDLTQGPDGFPEDTVGGAVRGFEDGAYRMSVTGDPGVVMTGIRAPTTHLVLAIEVDVRPDAQPAGSEFGVICWQSETQGYGFLVAADGGTRLVAMSWTGSFMTDVATGRTTVLPTGSVHALMIACGVIGSSATLAGYVDGVKVLEAQAPNPPADLDVGGMLGVNTSTERASWSVLSFERHGVHNMPPGWDS